MLDPTILQSLVSKKYRSLLLLYCDYLDLGWKHFYEKTQNVDVKLEKIRLLEKAVRQELPLKQTMLAQLQKQFVAENLSSSLLMEPLQSWKYLAMQPEATSNEQVSDIIGHIVSPLARLIMVLNNDESPSTYQPMQSLLALLFWQRLFATKSKLISKIKISAKRRQNKLFGFLKSSFVLLSIVQSKRLKWNLALLLNKLKLLVENNKQEQFSFLDLMRIFLYSLFQFVVVRKRTTLSRKGI